MVWRMLNSGNTGILKQLASTQVPPLPIRVRLEYLGPKNDVVLNHCWLSVLVIHSFDLPATRYAFCTRTEERHNGVRVTRVGLLPLLSSPHACSHMERLQSESYAYVSWSSVEWGLETAKSATLARVLADDMIAFSLL